MITLVCLRQRLPPSDSRLPSTMTLADDRTIEEGSVQSIHLRSTWTESIDIFGALGSNPLISAQPDGAIVAEWDAGPKKPPPGGSLEGLLDRKPLLLPFQQFPADPNRGMELPPTQLSFSAEARQISRYYF